MRLIILCLILNSTSLYAMELVFAFGPGNGEPFTIIKDEQLSGGLFKEIGEALAHNLGWAVRFRHAPTKRVSQLLMDGDINSICLTHPDWIEDSQKLFWSTMIAQDYDHLVSLSKKPFNFNQISDLKGLKVGAMTGYIYFDFFMDYIHKGHVIRRDFNNLSAMYASLWAERIDVAVDSLISIHYRTKTQVNSPALKVSNLAVYRYDLFCAFSEELMPFKGLILNQVKKMSRKGEFSRILNAYK